MPTITVTHETLRRFRQAKYKEQFEKGMHLSDEDTLALILNRYYEHPRPRRRKANTSKPPPALEYITGPDGKTYSPPRRVDTYGVPAPGKSHEEAPEGRS